MNKTHTLRKKIPAKQNINLAMKDSRKRELKPVILTALALTFFIVLFTKFAVIDQLAAAANAEYAAAKAQVDLASAKARTVDYDAVLEQYNNYHLSQSLVSGKTDFLDIMDLMEHELFPTSIVETFSSSDGIITVKISGVTLNQISQIFRNLTNSPLVSHVTVYTASSTEENKNSLTTAALTISLSAEEDAKHTASDQNTAGGQSS